MVQFDANILLSCLSTSPDKVESHKYASLSAEYKITLYLHKQQIFMKKRLTMTLATLSLSAGMAMAQSSVTGVVTSSEDGEPVIGATVKVKGSTDQGAVTNVDGEFKINAKPGTELIITYIGMQPKTVKASGNMRISLDADSETLGEVVVMGYGSARKLGTIAGSVATVGGDKLTNRPVANIADALQGQVAGLQVMTSSGEPSATASMRVRGFSSLNASTDPLYILDGSMISQNTFLSLNPNDIENITVLKDASSTAVYGSLAANGVVIITSKKGKFGEAATVTVSAQYGVSVLAGDKTTMMDANQWMAFQEMLTPSIASNADYLRKRNFYQKTGISTNWRKYLFGDATPTWQVDASVRGGTQSVNYLVSFGHYKMDGIMDDSGLQRETLRANIEINATPWLKIGSNGNLAFIKASTTTWGSTGNSLYNKTFAARMYLPTQSPYEILGADYDNGTFTGYGKKLHAYSNMSGLYSPEWLADLQPSSNDRIRINEGLYVNINPIKGLNIRSYVGLDANDYRSHYLCYNTQGEDYNIFPTGHAAESMSRYYRYTVTNTAEYKFNVAKRHDFTVLLGQETTKSRSEAFSTQTGGLEDNRLTLMPFGKQSLTSIPGQSKSDEVRNSWFTQINYNYDGRYFVDLSGRRDGSSLFAEGHRWGTFGSAALMWNATGEKFMQPYKNWLNELHVKVSYGVVGNSGISTNLFRALTGTSGTYGGVTGLAPVNASNPELSWETVNILNAGISGKLFHRLTFNVEFYDKRTNNMLLYVPVSYTTGYASRIKNIGNMYNRGVEFSLGYDIIHNKDWYWNANVAAGYNRNRITKLFNGLNEYVNSSTSKYEIGHDPTEFYMVRWSHVDPRDGQNVWLDKYGNETKVYDENNRVQTGKTANAPWTFGLQTTAAWKGLQLDVQFSGVFGRSMINQERYFTENPTFGSTWNQSTKMLNMWMKPGDVTDIAAASATRQSDTHLLENANFLRLKSLQLSYTLPEKWLEPTRILKGVKVYFVSRNLLTFTSYSGYDPEVDSYLSIGDYPNTRQFSFGAQLTF